MVSKADLGSIARLNLHPETVDRFHEKPGIETQPFESIDAILKAEQSLPSTFSSGNGTVRRNQVIAYNELGFQVEDEKYTNKDGTTVSESQVVEGIQAYVEIAKGISEGIRGTMLGFGSPYQLIQGITNFNDAVSKAKASGMKLDTEGISETYNKLVTQALGIVELELKRTESVDYQSERVTLMEHLYGHDERLPLIEVLDLAVEMSPHTKGDFKERVSQAISGVQQRLEGELSYLKREEAKDPTAYRQSVQTERALERTREIARNYTA